MNSALAVVVVGSLWSIVLIPYFLKRITETRSARPSKPVSQPVSDKVFFLPGVAGYPFSPEVAGYSAPGENLGLVGMDTTRAILRERSRRRRRKVFFTLIAFFVFSLIALLAAPAPLTLALNVVADVLLGGFSLALARRSRRIRESQVHVRVAERTSDTSAGAARLEPVRLVSSAAGRR